MLFGIDSTYLWMALAIGLAVLEMSTSTLVCIWFVIGSLFAFGVSFISSSLPLQIAVFALVSGLSLAFTRPLAKKILYKKPIPTNRDLLIGTVCVVTQDIAPGGKGRVKSGDISWLAQSDIPMKKGEQARIVEISGATLVVCPVNAVVNQ